MINSIERPQGVLERPGACSAMSIAPSAILHLQQPFI
jgi:hypothetical protein